MLRSYFFIPADKRKFIEKVEELRADFFVFDLEDSVARTDLEEAIDNIKKIKAKSNYLIRLNSIFDIEQSFFNQFVKRGFSNFILPKVGSIEELEIINQRSVKDKYLKFILLIENPKLLIQLPEILNKLGDQITGLGLGSHDFANQMGMDHTYLNLQFARNMLLVYGKAYGKEVIDIASMELYNVKNIKQEIYEAYSSGHDGKFFIHPFQLKQLETVNFFSAEELELAQQVISIIGKETDFKPFKVHGRIIEKPHVSRFKRIIKWSKRNEN
ncbi:MAG: hypothetical protein JJ971_07370 [Balneolaceae bacterium]|nr:hypothetical protein [Balneolaceae bacterium]MBO6546947.1 hypothetical protein [Balneolaceae bacterium]MBO6649307.1 hypothetical protein [Balneolaceae bacterium]